MSDISIPRQSLLLHSLNSGSLHVIGKNIFRIVIIYINWKSLIGNKLISY